MSVRKLTFVCPRITWILVLLSLQPRTCFGGSNQTTLQGRLLSNYMKIVKALPVLLLMICLPMMARAQLVSLKTVPVATGDQFLVFPSLVSTGNLLSKKSSNNLYALTIGLDRKWHPKIPNYAPGLMLLYLWKPAAAGSSPREVKLSKTFNFSAT